MFFFTIYNPVRTANYVVAANNHPQGNHPVNVQQGLGQPRLLRVARITTIALLIITSLMCGIASVLIATRIDSKAGQIVTGLTILPLVLSLIMLKYSCQQ